MAEYIEREALMKNFCGYDLTKCVKYGNENAEQRHDSYSTMMMYEIADEIDDAPSADVAPVRHGKWVQDGQRVAGGVDWYHCSVCLHPESGVYAKRPFCSMCGAKMDLEG